MVINQNSLHQNKNREEVKNRELRYLPDLSIFNLHSVFVLVQRILNYYPNYPTHRLYFGEVETSYRGHNFARYGPNPGNIEIITISPELKYFQNTTNTRWLGISLVSNMYSASADLSAIQ